jgi:predicted GIY-YIG superfamily endonuclease
MNSYYVYALLREDKTPFYIGASRDAQRFDNHVYGKNPVIAEMRSRGVKPGLKIIKKGLSRTQALDMERDIIAGIGLDCLTNGNGSVGKVTVSIDEWLRTGKCREARALLNWSMTDLAKAAGTDLWTIVDFELTGRKIQPDTSQAIRIALEIAGVMFDGNGGVHFSKRRPK